MTTDRPEEAAPDLPALWQATWRLLGRPAPVKARDQLMKAWSEPQRHYHDLRHLQECLGRWSAWQTLAERPGEVALALWFHDAVYEPLAKDNELLSAAWAVQVMTACELDSAAADRVHRLIMATCHQAEPEGPDAALVVDIDLAILGAAPERFEAYDRDVRKEYRVVPGFLYRRKRREVLQAFLELPRIYRTPPARDALEATARVNLQAALSRLAA